MRELGTAILVLLIYSWIAPESLGRVARQSYDGIQRGWSQPEVK